MGFNLGVTAFSSEPDIAGLRDAMSGGKWRVYGAPDQSAWLLDFGSGPKDPGPNFWDATAFLAPRGTPAVADLPDLHEEPSELLADLAYSAKLLSRAAGAPCFTCISSDELIDAVATADGGEITLMAAIEQRDEKIDERRHHDRVIAHIYENGEARQEILADLIVVDDGKTVFIEQEIVPGYVINGLSERMMTSFLGKRLPVFDDNYLASEQWGWPLIAMHPEKKKGGFFTKLFGR
ncbi:MAG: hypothetical protein AAF830_17095 [Pseudomonadota bacterium]